MRAAGKGQVTIPKAMRVAAGVGPGPEVAFGLKGSKFVITPVAAGIKEARTRALHGQLRAPFVRALAASLPLDATARVTMAIPTDILEAEAQSLPQAHRSRWVEPAAFLAVGLLLALNGHRQQAAQPEAALTLLEQQAMASAARDTLEPGTRLSLFGSRVQDTMGVRLTYEYPDQPELRYAQLLAAIAAAAAPSAAYRGWAAKLAAANSA